MKISKINRPGKNLPYGVRYEEAGKTKHKFFKTKSARDGFHRSLLDTAAREGFALFDISAADAGIMRQCIEKLGSSEAVLAAVLDYERRHVAKPIDMTAAIKEHLDEAYNQGRDENYLRASRNILRRFAHTHTGKVNSITKADAVKWIHSLRFAPVTIKNHVTRMKVFYNWAIERGYAAENPFNKLPLPDVIEKEPEFLTVNQMSELLQTAKAHYPDAVAYFALNGFAGLRSSACARIGLADIDFKQRGILIRATNAKNKRRVYLDGYEPNLWAWLDWAKDNAPEGFELSKRLWDRRRGQVQELAGVKMPHNALRHSFCTYHVALHGDAGKTATLLTHRGNVSILYDHYKGNASRNEAQQFFNILPSETQS